ncbi:MAG: peptidylprolyl isomerase [Deltaproteobacteria bacterium]|nr:peptidylprolyl isomerase [Deltaproteobacteria bacterium]
MKQHGIWTALLVWVMVWPSFSQAAMKDGIAAVVNEEIITIYELNRAFAPIRMKIDASYQGQKREDVVTQSKKAVLNRMINDMLIEQEAEKMGIVIREDEVNATIDDILRRQNITKNDLLKMLEKENLTLDDYKKDLKTQLARMRLLRREVNAKIAVSNEEIGEYYSKNREYFEGREAVRIKQVLLSFPRHIDEQGKAALQAEAQKIVNQLKSGESFEQLIANYSKDSFSLSGGDLGFVERGVILPDVEKVAFSLSLEEISDVIESPVGFHVIKVTDKKGAGAKSIELVRSEIQEKILSEKAEKRFEGFIEELRKKSHVEIRI